ncbi:MAG: hypothetical protein QOJ98_2279 [Acidobacteriota bacterium]|nr:hypothetical protein [Acidobacteriota bacterium]
MRRVEEAVAGRRPMRPMPLAEAWIRDHGEAYAGRWVALSDYELIAAADSFTELKRQIPPSVDVLVTVIE